MKCCGVDKRTIGIGVGGASVVGVAFGMARYAYGMTVPDVRAEFGLSEMLLGLIASGTFAGYLIGLVSVPRLEARRGPRRRPWAVCAGSWAGRPSRSPRHRGSSQQEPCSAVVPQVGCGLRTPTS